MSLWIVILACFLVSTTFASSYRGNDRYLSIFDPPPDPDSSVLDNSLTSTNGEMRFFDELGLIPQTCKYKGAKFDCGLSISCVLGGGRPVDLCSGGLIWSCCVDDDDIPEKDPQPSVGLLQNATFSINLGHQRPYIDDDVAVYNRPGVSSGRPKPVYSGVPGHRPSYVFTDRPSLDFGTQKPYDNSAPPGHGGTGSSKPVSYSPQHWDANEVGRPHIQPSYGPDDYQHDVYQTDDEYSEGAGDEGHDFRGNGR